MERIKNIITIFEWTYENKPRLFALGIIIGGLGVYTVMSISTDNKDLIIADLRADKKQLRAELATAQKDCMEKLKEVKEFLKYIATE